MKFVQTYTRTGNTGIMMERVIILLLAGIGLLFPDIGARDHDGGGYADTDAENAEISRRLSVAGACIETAPDSAVGILEKIIHELENPKPALINEVSRLTIRANQKLLTDDPPRESGERRKAFAKMATDSTKRAFSYMYIGSDLFRLEKFGFSKYYFLQGLKISQALQHSGLTAFFWSSLGTVDFKQNRFEEALDSHVQALEIYRALNKGPESAAAYYSIGTDYSALCCYDKAIENYLLALNFYEQNQDSANIAMVFHAIGLVYEDIGNLNRAQEYNLRALQLIDESDWEVYTSIVKWLGTISLLKGDYDQAKEYLFSALAIESRKHASVSQAITEVKLAEVYLGLGDTGRAHDFCTQAQRRLGGIADHWIKVKLNDLLGLVYQNRDQHHAAEACFFEGLELSTKLKVRDLTADIYRSLADFYQESRDIPRAFEYLQKYIALRDSIHTQNGHRIADMQFRYETDKRKKENEILRRNNAIQELELQKQTLIQTIQLLMILIFIALIALLMHRYRIKNKLNKSLQQRVEDTIRRHREQQQIIIHQAGLTSLGELAASIIHDILQPIQNIRLTAESAALKISAGPGGDDGLFAMMNEIKADVFRAEKIVKHIRIFAKKDKQAGQDKFDVNEAIRDAVQVTGRQFKSQKITVETRLADDLPMTAGNHYNFEQIIVNLLLNARDAIYQKRIRDSLLPGHIRIETVLSGGAVKVMLTDNGSGIPDQVKVHIFKPFFTTKDAGEGTGLGLVIVNKMIRELGGRIEYQSVQDEGTTVMIDIPLQKQTGLRERVKLGSN